MPFNLDKNKQAQEVMFSKKQLKVDLLLFNNIPVYWTLISKYPSLFCDEKLNFQYHIKEKSK